MLGLLMTMSHSAQADHSFCQSLQPSPALTPFVDALPIPQTINVNGTQLILGAYKITQKLHSNLSATTLYAYGTSQLTATYPGPTLVASRGVPALVRYENHINDSTHFLTVDTTIHWANPPHGGVPIVTHLHGAETPSVSDGHPDAWFTAFGDHGPSFTTQNYTYPNSQPATALWYHDHTVGITRLNVLAGLAGLYLIRSPSDDPPNLPSGSYEIPLIIQDKTFWSNGSINFPDTGDVVGTHPNWCPEYFGDTILVNGKVWPYLNVYPAKYRFRILNAANARFFNLSLSNSSLKFYQIGTDGGYLPYTLTLSSLLIAPAYRLDVIIDFSSLSPGTTVYMNNSAAAPFPSGSSDLSPPGTNYVLKFNVVSSSGLTPVAQAIPTSIAPNYSVSYYNITYRNMTLKEFDDPVTGNPVVSLLNNMSWTDPTTEFPVNGATEIWGMINYTPDAHPMHIHLIQFLFLAQQPFNQTAAMDNLCSFKIPYGVAGTCFTSFPQLPDASQVGWKDTVIVYPQFVSTLWVRWTTRNGSGFPFDPTIGPGYIWHCHIVDHEDNDMMRPLKLVSS